MKIRGVIKRFICFVLAIGIISPNASTIIINVCADEETITKLIWLAPMPGSNDIEYDIIGIVKECAVREYPKSWIGRYQAA